MPAMQQSYPQAIALEPVDQFLAGHLVPVSSSNVAAIGWIADVAALRVRYKDGRTARYFPISKSEVLSCFYAPSIGKWLWSFVRVRGDKHTHQRGWAYE